VERPGPQQPERARAAPAAKSAITVVIADDQRLMRSGLRVILEDEPDIAVVAEASDGREAVSLVARHAPAVALLDIRMPNMDGLAAARQVMARYPATRVVILTTFDADDYLYEALRAGVSGFLLKDAPADQLVTAVRCAAAGDALIDPAVTRRLIARLATVAPAPSGAPGRLDALTARERDVLRLVAAGHSNSEIARHLVIEENTVKTHVSRILMKLDLRDRVQAVVLAYESGFVIPESQA
jgi:DNA-binding NarL/FixJ family response regulator